LIYDGEVIERVPVLVLPIAESNYADAHNNLGIALSEMGRFDDAVASHTRRLELRPNHVDAHMNRALTWLRKGDYSQG
jgi:lipoprotein NlpI